MLGQLICWCEGAGQPCPKPWGILGAAGFSWLRVPSHFVQNVFLPTNMQCHVLLLSLCPSDRGGIFKVSGGVWEDTHGRCVSEKPEYTAKPEENMGVIPGVMLWYLCGLVSGCGVKRGSIPSQSCQAVLAFAAVLCRMNFSFHHGHSSFNVYLTPNVVLMVPINRD